MHQRNISWSQAREEPRLGCELSSGSVTGPYCPPILHHFSSRQYLKECLSELIDTGAPCPPPEGMAPSKMNWSELKPLIWTSLAVCSHWPQRINPVAEMSLNGPNIMHQWWCTEESSALLSTVSPGRPSPGSRHIPLWDLWDLEASGLGCREDTFAITGANKELYPLITLY